MAGRRIFIAIDISDAARAVCAALIQHLRPQFPKVRVGWERPEKLHITLKFLGDTADDLVENVSKSVADVGSNHQPFKLKLAGPGVFPAASRPRILWVGIDDASGAVTDLNRRVEDVCERLGYEKEKKRFHPHITIGRVREPHGASILADAHLKTVIEPVEFDVKSLVIYESKLLPAGSVYSVVEQLSLKG